MKWFFMFVALLAVSFVGIAADYAMVDSGGAFINYTRSYQLEKNRGRYFTVPITQAEKDVGWNNLSQAVRDAKVQSERDKYIATKSSTLKMAENAMIQWLGRTGYISTNATSVPVGMENTVITSLLAQAISSPTNTQVDALITRFHSLQNLITTEGGTVDECILHP